MSKYLWCEDSGSGYLFWRTLCGYLYPDVMVETKGNNSRLRAAVGQIKNDGNEYYILMDDAADNPDVIRETNALRKNAEGKSNVSLILVHSFEFALLSFRFLEQWVFADLNEQAEAMFLELVKQLSAREGVAEQLKAQDHLLWAQQMNNIRDRTMEIVNHNLIYA